MTLTPCSPGHAQCEWCQVDIEPSRWNLCASCEADALCLHCGQPLGEYNARELHPACYLKVPFTFHYQLVKKGRKPCQQTSQ